MAQSQNESDEDRAVASLLAARRSLIAGLDRSRSLVSEMSRAGPHLEEIKRRLPSLEAAVRPIRAPREALMEVGGHIDRAVGPAAAVLKVFDAVHGLERPLLSGDGPGVDLPGFLDVLTRLEEALKFLSDNSGLAVQWLEDIIEYLADHSLADPRFISQLTDTLSSLKSSSASPPEPLDGGLLSATLNRLESEFCQLLSAHSTPLPLQPPDTAGDTAIAIAPSPLPVPVIRMLSLILDRMAANNYLDKCVSAFVDIRGSNVHKSLEALGIDYLDSTLDDAQMHGPHVQRWGRHLEFTVKHLLESEYRVCAEVFDRRPAELASCFADVAARAGILDFIKFGRTVCDAKKDPIKLLRLLEIFDSLNKLRLDFNRLFGSKACADIQTQTRDLIKRVVEGACEIFGELLLQVELQRNVPPPPDGAVPRLVSFITEYCNRLLSDEYRPVLTQVLIIQRSWKQERFHERLLVDAILNIVKALELNFEKWSKGYEDPNLAYLFMMNTHWHFFKHLKGTRLGDHLGDTWLREHEQYKDYYVAMFLRETWGKLPGLLSREGLMIFSGGRATARDLVKKRLKSFNDMFNEMHQKQSNWVISDNELRDKMCNLVVQAVVPVYRSYMQNYGPLVEQDASASKYAKFTAQGLEKMLGSLFQNRPRKSVSFNVRHSNGKANTAVTGLYRSTSTVK